MWVRLRARAYNKISENDVGKIVELWGTNYHWEGVRGVGVALGSALFQYVGASEE